MRISTRQKDFLASIGVGILSMILFVLLMGTVVLWGQSTGEKVRSKLSSEQTQTTDGNASQ
jgi:cell division protein FtsL